MSDQDDTDISKPPAEPLNVTVPVNQDSETSNTSNEQPNLPVDASPAQRSRRRLFVVIAIVLVIIIIGAGAWILLSKHQQPAASNTAPISIGLSMASLTVARWPVEQAIMEKDASAAGASIIAYNANDDTNTQISQIENLIAQKVDVIIINANDSSLLAPAVEAAAKAGIKVIAYDRLIDGSGTTQYISFSSYQVGVDWANFIVSALPASLKTANVAFLDGAPTDNNSTLLRNGVMSVLSPLITSGKIDLAFNQNIANWDPGVAYTTFKTDVATGTRIDAVIGGNDELANSAIEILQTEGLAGKIPVTGQDGELSAIQRIEAGTQSLTVYKPGYDEANLAVKDAILMAKGKSVQSNTTTNNGTINVPSYLFTPISVTKANVNSVIIKGGVYTSEQIFGTSSTAN